MHIILIQLFAARTNKTLLLVAVESFVALHIQSLSMPVSAYIVGFHQVQSKAMFSVSNNVANALAKQRTVRHAVVSPGVGKQRRLSRLDNGEARDGTRCE